jgi:hypothetical protein
MGTQETIKQLTGISTFVYFEVGDESAAQEAASHWPLLQTVNHSLRPDEPVSEGIYVQNANGAGAMPAATPDGMNPQGEYSYSLPGLTPAAAQQEANPPVAETGEQQTSFIPTMSVPGLSTMGLTSPGMEGPGLTASAGAYAVQPGGDPDEGLVPRSPDAHPGGSPGDEPEASLPGDWPMLVTSQTGKVPSAG